MYLRHSSYVALPSSDVGLGGGSAAEGAWGSRNGAATKEECHWVTRAGSLKWVVERVTVPASAASQSEHRSGSRESAWHRQIARSSPRSRARESTRCGSSRSISTDAGRSHGPTAGSATASNGRERLMDGSVSSAREPVRSILCGSCISLVERLARNQANTDLGPVNPLRASGVCSDSELAVFAHAAPQTQRCYLSEPPQGQAERDKQEREGFIGEKRCHEVIEWEVDETKRPTTVTLPPNLNASRD